VRVETEYFAAQFVVKSGHDGDDKDEDGDAESDAEHGDDADDRYKGPFWSEVSEGEEERDGESHEIKRGGSEVGIGRAVWR
jgi:hypothetical protein